MAPKKKQRTSKSSGAVNDVQDLSKLQLDACCTKRALLLCVGAKPI